MIEAPRPLSIFSEHHVVSPSITDDVMLMPLAEDVELKSPIDRPPEVQLVTQMLLASGSADPVQALMGVLHQLRAISGDRAEHDVRTAQQSQEVARLRHDKAIEDAKAAAEKRLKRAPKWVKKLVSIIVTAVGVVASAFTGGASLGLAIAGAVLLLAADGIAKLGIKLGMDEKHAAWLKVGVQVAGAALMLGAGAAGGASAAVPKAVEVAQKSAKVVKAAMAAVEFSVGMVDETRAEQQAQAECDAADASLAVDAAEDETKRAVELLGEELARMQRQSESISAMSEVNRQTVQHIIEQFTGGSR
jgi:hypothetical protein